MGTVTVKVGDMACGHCVATIQGAVEKLAGVTGMEADLETKLVAVTFSEEPNREAVMSAIRSAGYSPEAAE